MHENFLPPQTVVITRLKKMFFVASPRQRVVHLRPGRRLRLSGVPLVRRRPPPGRGQEGLRLPGLPVRGGAAPPRRPTAPEAGKGEVHAGKEAVPPLSPSVPRRTPRSAVRPPLGTLLRPHPAPQGRHLLPHLCSPPCLHLRQEPPPLCLPPQGNSRLLAGEGVINGCAIPK